MEVSNVFHMNGRETQHSYEKNSLLQKKVILTAKPIVEESIAELFEKNKLESVRMADLGCSSGPNTLLPLWQIIDTIDSAYSSLNQKPPMLQYFLNDIPGNDFTTIFRSFVPRFYEELAKEKGDRFEDCFIAAVPGSFYGRLFPSNSLHFVHSSFSLHWSSQVHNGLGSEFRIQLNKGNICLAESSPAVVHKAYQNQFEKDFTKFLRSRWVEMVTGGRMVTTFIAQTHKNPYHRKWELLRNCLKEMVNEGIIEESKLDSFSIAFNSPRVEQVRNVIEREGLFGIKEMKEMELNWDANIEDGNNDLVFDKWERGQHVANYTRAVLEPIVANHFGDAILDNLFRRFSFQVADCLEKGNGVLSYVVVSMTKI